MYSITGILISQQFFLTFLTFFLPMKKAPETVGANAEEGT